MNNTNHEYVSIDYITNRILKHPLLKDTNPEDINDLVIGCLRMGNLPGLNKDVVCKRKIDCHKVLIPKEALRVKKVGLVVGNTIKPLYYNNTNSGLTPKTIGPTNTYTINDRVIIVPFEKGEVVITYESFILDESGIPMIPKSETMFRMLDSYVKMNVFGVLFDLGKISEKSLLRAEQDYYFYIGKLETEYKGIRNEDHMEAIINNHTRLFDVDGVDNQGIKTVLKSNSSIL